MSTKYLNNALPFELLKKIFQYLNKTCRKKKDIKTCLSVCKSWQAAAEDFFGEMSVEVYEDSLERLSKDVVYFGQKVKSISLRNNNRSARVDNKVTCLIWLDIILACPNLVSIKISIKFSYNYVRCLMITETERFGRIQSLSTTSAESNSSQKDSDKSLVKFASRFPKLTSIEVKDPGDRRFYMMYSLRTIDIARLLEVAPHLQKIDVFHLTEMMSSSLKTISTNLCLTSLKLEVYKMDINALIIFTTRFEQLNYLCLKIQNLIVDYPEGEFDEENFFVALYYVIKRIPEFYVSYEYRCERYIMQNDEELCIESFYSRTKDKHKYTD